MVESLAKLGTVFIKFKKNPAPATFSRRSVYCRVYCRRSLK